MLKTLLAGIAIAVSLAASTGSADARCHDRKDRNVKVVNDTTFSLRQLYGSNVKADSWQEDVLGNRVLLPGHSISVNFDDGTCLCSFDLKAVFSDNTSTIRRAFNVCKTGVWRIHE